jgi:hypothetical protein
MISSPTFNAISNEYHVQIVKLEPTSRYRFITLHISTCITKLCRRQAEVIQNHENVHVGGTEQGETRLKLGDGHADDRSND